MPVSYTHLDVYKRQPSNREEVRKFMMKRTISGMIGAGSLAHNRRDFVAENVDPDRVQLKMCIRDSRIAVPKQKMDF